MKTEIDIRKTVKCILEVSEENICREVTVGQSYKVQAEDDEHYYLIDNTGKSKYYEKQYFELSQPLPKDESKEGEDNNGWIKIAPDRSNLPTDEKDSGVEYIWLTREGNIYTGESWPVRMASIFSETHYRAVEKYKLPNY